VPDDGVEPLTAESGESTTATVEAPPQEFEAFEADDFWASGDTQQFVGTGRSSGPIGGPPGDDSVSSRAVTGEPAVAAVSGDVPLPETGLPSWRRPLPVTLPTSWIAASVVVAGLAATILLIVSLTSGASYKVARHSSASFSRAVKPVKPWVAYSAKPSAAKRHVARPHPKTPARSTSSASAGTPSSSQPAGSAPVQAQPVYQPSPSASAAGDTGSSSSSGGGASSSGQRAGPTSPIGIGTSPSG